MNLNTSIIKFSYFPMINYDIDVTFGFNYYIDYNIKIY